MSPARRIVDVDVETTPYLDDRPSRGERWTLNFGPQHPATHTTLRVVLELDGERVVRAVPHIGYLHSGFEKLGEHHNYNQYVVVTDRMNYVSPLANNIAWHHAVEKLFGIDLTPRCKVLRTIMGELARIQDHLLAIGANTLEMGALTAFLYGFNEREAINNICEFACGHRFTASWTRLGGLKQDLPDEAVFRKMVKQFVNEQLPQAIADLERLLNNNRIFIDRALGVGAVTREQAIQWGLTGPLARAAGVMRDQRIDEPYLCFADNWDGQGAKAVEFQIPLMDTGDVYGRYRVRVEEMKQSAHIIRQLIDNIPDGPVDVYVDEKVHLPDKSEVYGSIEGLIQHFELIMTNRGWQAPVGESYAAIEAPNGELGFYIVAEGGPRPWRVKCRAPSFVNFSAYSQMLEGHMLADVPVIMGSINIIAAELDR